MCLNHLFFSYLRTGNYLKAKETVIKALVLNSMKINEETLVIFFLNNGLVQLHEGLIDEAKSSFFKVINFILIIFLYV